LILRPLPEQVQRTNQKKKYAGQELTAKILLEYETG
jgi:hypothetical protein